MSHVLQLESRAVFLIWLPLLYHTHTAKENSYILHGNTNTNHCRPTRKIIPTDMALQSTTHSDRFGCVNQIQSSTVARSRLSHTHAIHSYRLQFNTQRQSTQVNRFVIRNRLPRPLEPVTDYTYTWDIWWYLKYPTPVLKGQTKADWSFFTFWKPNVGLISCLIYIVLMFTNTRQRLNSNYYQNHK